MVDSMITLFETTSTEFVTNGLGNLPDAISCIVTEERNGQFELEMEYPIIGKRYGELSLRRIIVAKTNPYSDPQPFRIYEITKPINGISTIYAQHISYDLSGYPVAPFSAESVVNALVNMKKASVLNCPFTFSTDKTTLANMKVLTPSSMRALLGGNEGSVLDVYGGEYEFNKFEVKLWNNRGSNRGVSIRYGKNLTDLKQEENCASVYTGVYPYWYSEQDGLQQLPEQIISAEGEYNFTRIYPLDLSQEWQNKPTEDQLRERAKAYMKNNNIGIPKVSLDVSFIQLAQSAEYKEIALLETVYLCDTVNVEFPELGVSATAKCIKTTYNVLTDKYEKIELGSAKSNLASTISDQSKAISDTPTKTSMEQAIENATQLISGGLGGYVVMHSSTGGQHPDEILIMDANDIKTANKVWRWNKNGLGYSSKGYNGPYTTAITQDGRIVADFITAGEFDGTLIKAGTIFADMLDIEYRNSVTKYADDVGKEVVEETAVKLKTLSDSIVAEVNRSTNADKDMNTKIVLNANGLKSKVSYGEVSSQISQEADVVTLKSNRVVIESDNLKINKNSAINASGAFSTTAGSMSNNDYRRAVLSAGRLMLSSTDPVLGNGNIEPASLDGYDGSKKYGIRIYNWYDFIALSQNALSGWDYLLNGDVDPSGCTDRHIFSKNIWVDGKIKPSSIQWRNESGTKVSPGNITVSGTESEGTYINGALGVDGNFVVTGQKKRVIGTKTYGRVSMNAWETTGAFFSDIGNGKIGEDGICVIVCDDRFRETIDITHELYVSVTKTSAGNIEYVEKTGCDMVVHGSFGTEFDWVVTGKQIDYVLERLEDCELDQVVSEIPYTDSYSEKLEDYAITAFNADLDNDTIEQDAENYLKNYQEELES